MTKINQILNTLPPGGVLLSFWMAKHGYSPDLQKRYRSSKWLQSIGSGAMVRTGDKVTYEGAIHALQTQASLTIHPGGRTALALQGKAQYLQMGAGKVTIFGGLKDRLPLWFQKHDWGVEVEYHKSSFLPSDL